MPATSASPINISSVIIGAHPGRSSELGLELASLSGVEVHAVADDGRLVVTIEADSDGDTVQTFEAIRQLPGVLSASLVYHQYESDPDEEA